jgi:hypothetical protein
MLLGGAPPILAQQPACKVIDPELQESYEGGCRNGLAQGRGVARGTAVYEGEFRRGMKEGKGVKSWPWGDRYEGEFKKDKKDGRGVYTWGAQTQWAGERYEGQFKSDRRDGWGVYIWPNGDRYEGNWKQDQRPGYSPMEIHKRQALAAQQEAFKPGATVCWLGSSAQAELGVVKGEVESFDGSVLRIKLVELPAKLTDNPQSPYRVGQVVTDGPIAWTLCI